MTQSNKSQQSKYVLKFRERFVLKGSDCTWNTYPTPEELEQFLQDMEVEIRAEERERIRRQIDGMRKKHVNTEIHNLTNHAKGQRMGYQQALENVLKLLADQR